VHRLDQSVVIHSKVIVHTHSGPTVCHTLKIVMYFTIFGGGLFF